MGFRLKWPTKVIGMTTQWMDDCMNLMHAHTHSTHACIHVQGAKLLVEKWKATSNQWSIATCTYLLMCHWLIVNLYERWYVYLTRCYLIETVFSLSQDHIALGFLDLLHWVNCLSSSCFNLWRSLLLFWYREGPRQIVSIIIVSRSSTSDYYGKEGNWIKIVSLIIC